MGFHCTYRISLHCNNVLALEEDTRVHGADRKCRRLACCDELKHGVFYIKPIYQKLSGDNLKVPRRRVVCN